MNISEIEGYIATGSSNMVCVDRSLLAEYPGFVRSVSIAEGFRIIVEYDVYGYDEGGVYIEFIYKDLCSAVTAAEAYLGVRPGMLGNFTKSGDYPEEPVGVDVDRSSVMFEESLRRGELFLPSGWVEKKMPIGYWRDIAEGKL